jgi:predicted translin family RNA/ssDNA-binding protein
MPHIDTHYLALVKTKTLEYAIKRREVIKGAGDAQHLAKRAIFALQRGDSKEAQAKLADAEKLYRELNKKYRSTPLLFSEGSYTAGLEEYVEARLFYSFVQNTKMGKIKELPVSDEIYIAGMCDVPGELYRFAIRAATVRDFATVQRCATTSDEIIGILVEFNLTSYLRTKFDQAKQAHQKLEQVIYEVSLRHES